MSVAVEPFSWQHTLWQQVADRALKDQMAHAFLLKGLPGLGKMHFAKTFAHWLLCEESGRLPCLQCKGCALVLAGSHPDLLVVEPEEEGKVIKIAQVRTLNDFSQKTAQQGGLRIIIVGPAEAMNINAANALLKCLEEPGNKTLFMLVSHRSGDMLPTIRSRCQALVFSIPARDVAQHWLASRLSEPEQAELLLRLAAGSPLMALQMAQQGVLVQRDQLILSVKGLFRGEKTVVELGKEWQGKDCLLLLDWLSGWLEDVIRIGLTGSDEYVHNPDLKTFLQYLARKTTPVQAIDLRDWLLAQRHLLMGGANLNLQMATEGVFCRLLGLLF